MRGALGERADHLDVDADRHVTDDGRGVVARVRERRVRRRAEHMQRRARQDPFAAPLFGHIRIYWPAQYQDVAPRRFDAVHFCEGTAGMNCVPPSASTTVANATPVPDLGAMRSVVAGVIAMPRRFSRSGTSRRPSP